MGVNTQSEERIKRDRTGTKIWQCVHSLNHQAMLIMQVFCFSETMQHITAGCTMLVCRECHRKHEKIKIKATDCLKYLL